MENKTLRNYYLFSILGVFLASCYPIYMGLSVIADMIRYGTVYAENYPKYIIPYTPIALSLLFGVALIPITTKHFKKYPLLFGTASSTVVFFAVEFLLERTVTVTRTVTGIFSTLEDWQMYMCYVPPNSFEERTWTEVDILMGEYSPAFKFHFYLISVVLIISILNCFYGFAKMIHTGGESRRKSLVIQSIASGAFLGMCIWACFTAFYRNGDIKVSALSAVLMSVFFVLFGVSLGIYIASFTLNKKPLLSIWLPSVSAAVFTLVMYIGEMILLSGHLYRFGNGFFFEGIPGIVLAPVDIIVILASGVIATIIANFVRNKNT
ncbi:MAG: hypothetical protein IJO74_00090 [Clostridia bacterium]|nr:hypothetical protein [Clostridia bacterium]